MFAVEQPLPIFTDTDGTPLTSGYLYFGTINLNPETNPITVYWDAAGTQPAAQPIRTINGLPVRNGIAVPVYASGDYSLTVRDVKGRLVLSRPSTMSSNNAGINAAAIQALADDLADTSNVAKGDALVGVKRTATGAVAMTQHDLNELQTLTPEDFGAVGDLSADDTTKVQAALDAMASGDTLILRRNYKLTSTGCTITNKSNITILGPGSLQLIGAAQTAVCLKPVGTCANVRIRGVRFVGAGNTTSSDLQYGVANSSGQTLSNIIVEGCTFSSLNAGIVATAESGGTVTNYWMLNNLLEDCVGTGANGQGYGLFGSKVTNLHIKNNTIRRAQRHSIYVSRGSTTPGQDYGTQVHENVIEDHRSVGFSANTFPAIYCGRGYGYSIRNNTIRNFKDGGVMVQQDTANTASAGSSVIEGNNFFGRLNAVYSILVGEESNPTTYRLTNVRVANNYIETDVTTGGYQYEIRVPNGKHIEVVDNRFYVANTPGTYRCISVGAFAAAGAADIDNVLVARNVFRGSGGSTGQLVLAESNICSGAARVTIRDNDFDDAILNAPVSYGASVTNPRLLSFVNGQARGVYVAGDTSPSVGGNVTELSVVNSGATNITTLDDAADTQVVTLIFGDINTTVKHATGNIRLAGGVDFVSTPRDTLTLRYSSVFAQWLEVARSDNA